MRPSPPNGGSKDRSLRGACSRKGTFQKHTGSQRQTACRPAHALSKPNGWPAGSLYVISKNPKRHSPISVNSARESPTPSAKPGAAYWVGRAAEASGDVNAAEKSFQSASRHGTTYYGQLAAARSNSTVALASSRVSPGKA